MSGNSPRTTNPNKALLDVASMSTERPLDALLPALQQARRAPVPRTPVHQRVLEVAVEDRRGEAARARRAADADAARRRARTAD